MSNHSAKEQRRESTRAETISQGNSANSSIFRNTKSHHSTLGDQSESGESYQPSSQSPVYVVGKDGKKTIWKGGWVPPDCTIEIAGRSISGMVYVGKPPKKKQSKEIKRVPSNVYIDPDLEIIDPPYQPQYLSLSKELTYDKMSPADRGIYLNWLASGKRDQSYDLKYLVLYYMGIEYRYFIEKRNQLDIVELAEIKYEIDQLLNLCGPSILQLRMLEFREVIFYDDVQANVKNFGIFVSSGGTDIVDLLLGGLSVVKKAPIEKIVVLNSLRLNLTPEIFECYENCLYVFVSKFDEKFQQVYPNGLHISPTEEYIKKYYQGILNDFTIDEPLIVNGKKIPDLRNSEELRNVAISIGTMVADELQPYCDELNRNMSNFRETREFAFLPDLKSNDVKNTADDIVREWVYEIINQDEPITYKDILTLTKDKFTNEIKFTQWYQILIALHRVGYGVAPDIFPQIVGGDPNANVILYKYKSDFNDRTKSSGNYVSELFALIVGFELFQSDGDSIEDHISIIKKRLDQAKGLTKSEKERLKENYERFRDFGYHHSVFERADKAHFNFDKEVIKDTIKFYVKQEKSLLEKNLHKIVFLYKAFNLDVSLIESDFILSDDLQEEYNRLIRKSAG